MEEQGNLPYPYEFKDIRLDEQALLKYLHKCKYIISNIIAYIGDAYRSFFIDLKINQYSLTNRHQILIFDVCSVPILN